MNDAEPILAVLYPKPSDMKKEILFIHGAGEGAYIEDKKLAENLQHLLGFSYEVRYPEMQDESDPAYDIWSSQITEELAAIQGEVILVGHSLGGSVIIKFLSEKPIDKKIAAVCLAAAPMWGGDGGWTYDGYETLELPPKVNAMLGKELPLFLYHSSDDETVPFEHLSLYSKKFPDAIVRKLTGRGHQLNNNLMEVAIDIKSLHHRDRA